VRGFLSVFNLCLSSAVNVNFQPPCYGSGVGVQSPGDMEMRGVMGEWKRHACASLRHRPHVSDFLLSLYSRGPAFNPAPIWPAVYEMANDA
jgi:hypothetical protein